MSELTSIKGPSNLKGNSLSNLKDSLSNHKGRFCNPNSPKDNNNSLLSNLKDNNLNNSLLNSLSKASTKVSILSNLEVRLVSHSVFLTRSRTK